MQRKMVKFERLLMAASIGMAIYGAYILVWGLVEGQICYKQHCVLQGKPYFVAYAWLYVGMIVFGLVSAWRSKKNITQGMAGE